MACKRTAPSIERPRPRPRTKGDHCSHERKRRAHPRTAVAVCLHQRERQHEGETTRGLRGAGSPRTRPCCSRSLPGCVPPIRREGLRVFALRSGDSTECAGQSCRLPRRLRWKPAALGRSRAGMRRERKPGSQPRRSRAGASARESGGRAPPRSGESQQAEVRKHPTSELEFTAEGTCLTTPV